MVTTRERASPRQWPGKKGRKTGWAYLVPMPGVKYYLFTDDHTPAPRGRTKVAGTAPPPREERG